MTTATQLTEADIATIAAEYSIPPALLAGVIKGSGSSPTLGMPEATLLAYQLSPGAATSDPMRMLAVAASSLAQAFAQTGSWQEALSVYLTGDAQAATSPTSAVGGQVESILGAAAISPGLGMQGFTPADPRSFAAMSGALTTHAHSLLATGGAVTRETAQYAQQQGDQASAAGWRGTTLGTALQSAAQNNAAGYAAGECTYYVARSLGFIPGGLGNAEDWATNAEKMGMQVNATPAVGTAVVYGPSGPYSPQYGHVAVVTKVNADGTFQVSEMNVDGRWVADTRTSTMGSVLGFIHPPAGTDMTKAAPGLAQQVQATSASTPQQQARQMAALQATSQSQSRVVAREPQPKEVGEFAAQLQSAGIDPQDFIQHFPDVAAAVRRDLGALRVDVSTYADLHNQVVQQGLPVNRATLMTQVRAQPHPTYPTLTVGQMSDARGMAMLHSIQHTQQVPTTAEVAHLAQAQASWKDMASYYEQKALLRERAAQPQTSRPTVLQGGQTQAATPPAGISDNAASARQRAIDRGVSP